MAMDTKRVTIPVFAGGLSRQPSAARLPDQVEAASNVVCSVAVGTSKRAGTVFNRVVTGLTSGGNYRLHAIERDATEKYDIVYGVVSSNMTIRAFLDGNATAATVNITAAAQGYLNLGSATADDLRFITIADATYIVNTKATPTLVASDMYTVDRIVENYGELMSWRGTNGLRYQTRSADENASAGHWLYNDGGAAGVNAFCHANWTPFGNVLQVMPNGHYDNVNNVGVMSVYFKRMDLTANGAAFTLANMRLTLTGAFAGYEFVPGDMVRTSVGGVGVSWRVGSKIDANTLQLTTGHTADITVNVVNICQSGDVTINLAERALATMADVAREFERAFRTVSPNCCVSWVETDPQPFNTNYLYRAGHFRVTSPFRGTQANSIVLLHVSGFNWPGSPASGHMASIFLSGTQTTVAGTGTFAHALQTTEPTSRWTRVAPPGQSDAQFNLSTMPVKMTRTTLSPLVFDVAVGGWKPRMSGNSQSAPPPTMFTRGYPIVDISLFRDRIGVAAGEGVLLSQAGDYDNFWPDDAANIVDSDPIEVSPNSSKLSIIQRIIATGKSMLILAQGGQQLELSSADALTPTSVSLTPSSAKLSYDVRPVQIGPTVYFAGPVPTGAAVYEYFRSDDSTVPETAGDVTAHVQGLFSSCRTIAGEVSTRTILLLPAAGGTLFVYRSFFLGAQKRQSAWTNLTLTPTVRVCDIAVIGNRFRLLVETATSQYTIQTWQPDPESAPAGHGEPVVLDNLVALGAWTWGGVNSTQTLPSSLADTTLNTVVVPSGTAYAATVSGTTITVASVNMTAFAATHYAGRGFTATIDLSRPYVRDQDGTPDAGSTTMFKAVKVTLQTSGFALISTVKFGSVPQTTTFSAAAGFTSSTERQHWAIGNTSEALVRISSNQPRAMTISSLDIGIDRVTPL